MIGGSTALRSLTSMTSRMMAALQNDGGGGVPPTPTPHTTSTNSPTARPTRHATAPHRNPDHFQPTTASTDTLPGPARARATTIAIATNENSKPPDIALPNSPASHCGPSTNCTMMPTMIAAPSCVAAPRRIESPANSSLRVIVHARTPNRRVAKERQHVLLRGDAVGVPTAVEEAELPKAVPQKHNPEHDPHTQQTNIGPRERASGSQVGWNRSRFADSRHIHHPRLTQSRRHQVSVRDFTHSVCALRTVVAFSPSGNDCRRSVVVSRWHAGRAWMTRNSSNPKAEPFVSSFKPWP